MSSKKDLLNQAVVEVRETLRGLRDAAKDQGIPNNRFYQDLLDRMEPYSVRASLTWLREQCDPENDKPPSIRKLYALKQALEEYQDQTGLNPKPNQTPRITVHGPEIQLPEHHDAISHEVLQEKLQSIGKIILEDPTRAILMAGQYTASCVQKHADAGGSIMIFQDYLRTRIEFSHGITLSNMPLHSLRDIQTPEQAKRANPSFKNVAAILYTLSALAAADSFPWGNDQDLLDTVKDIRAHQKAEQEEQKKKKTPSLRQQNRALMDKVPGITIIKR